MATRQVEYHTVQVARESFFLDVRYTNLKPIGDGSYGFVCAADDSLTGRRVAIKKVGDTFNDLVDAKRVLREIKLLRHFIGHENIVQIYDIMTVPPNTEDFRDVYIVTNLMESDLDRIIGSNQPLSDQHFQYFLYQVLRGLKYLHSANVLHRDLKPSNLLVNANCDLTICDFGLARGVEGEYEEELTEYVVTRWYRAPELLCDSCYYGKTVDIWSLGCIFAEMLGRKPFFQGSNPLHQLETIVAKLGLPPPEQLTFVTHPAAKKAILARAEQQRPRPLLSFFPRGTNPQAVALLSRMLTFHPEYRITVEEALAHPYLHELHSQMDEPACQKAFDFEWERLLRGAGGDEGGGVRRKSVIPKPVLQRLMYAEMLFFRGLEEEEGGEEAGGGGAEGLKEEEATSSHHKHSASSSSSSSSLGMSESGGRGRGRSSNPVLPPPPSTAAALLACTSQRQHQQQQQQQQQQEAKVQAHGQEEKTRSNEAGVTETRGAVGPEGGREGGEGMKGGRRGWASSATGAGEGKEGPIESQTGKLEHIER
ncbi:hypothetical protein NSK_007579 [Nannochloropsis salina CCMP1776]|uniref:Mitogen-activated protein kinase n=1 Tax=Nannochloropsis salina CCMP1776 TaxID=1027361 RepID=A0A4D9CQA4_9STRA|nr:hypothetical protein NSK_007579 [Nannochloropsis salina CCMP1776]|eukprot:TFJ80936.1 hypothetical protein NSK_007579 [Nannochloropsis salina CCMP1776]